jgi:3-deoxy-D-manno-octulosonic-acid transferase
MLTQSLTYQPRFKERDVERILARAATAAAATALLPVALGRACFDVPWRASLAERFGGGDWNTVPEDFSSCLWIHAASVGEVTGVAPVLDLLRKKYPAEKILVSTTSLTGKEKARETKLADMVCLLPFDHPWFVRRVLQRIKPKLFLVSETELWPNLLFQLASNKVPVVVINGRISDYSFPKYQYLGCVVRPMLSTITGVLAQTELDRQRFVGLGMNPARVYVVGSTKYDRIVPSLNEEELQEFARDLGLSLAQPCFVAGSVRQGEDEEVIKAYTEALRDVPALQMIIAPRHPERFEEVAKLLNAYGLRYNRRSQGQAEQNKAVLLLDTLGELTKVYALASFVFVGGTLVNIGGHNPLEAAAYSKAVIVGPYTTNVREAIVALREEKGVSEVTCAQDLAEVLVKLTSEIELCLRMGKNAHHVWGRNIGATQRVMGHLEEWYTS